MSENTIPLDRYSRAILTELQRDSRQTVQAIADAVAKPQSRCATRPPSC